MRAIVATVPGVVELNWVWLPTFIGMDTRLKQEIESSLREHLVGKALTDQTLDWAHDQIVALLIQKFPGISGLREFFDGLKSVDVS